MERTGRFVEDAERGTTRDRLREAALTLFSERGFRGATIGEIEAAAGLTPRAGSFYRYYSSKKALLEDCVETFLEESFGAFTPDDLLPLGDVRSELLLIARTILRVADRHRPIRILLRHEWRRDPALIQRMAQINRRFGMEALLPWLRDRSEADEVSDEGLRTRCLIIFGPILYYMLEMDIQQQAFDLDQEAVIEEWATFWASRLDVDRD